MAETTNPNGDLSLIEALLADTTSTAEATGPMGAGMLAVPKPSRDGPDAKSDVTSDSADRWVLEFASFPGDDRPIGRRIAQLCKHAKRALGLKVLIVRDPDQPIVNDDEKPSSHR
jgi:hypothetical protein